MEIFHQASNFGIPKIWTIQETEEISDHKNRYNENVQFPHNLLLFLGINEDMGGAGISSNKHILGDAVWRCFLRHDGQNPQDADIAILNVAVWQRCQMNDGILSE